MKALLTERNKKPEVTIRGHYGRYRHSNNDYITQHNLVTQKEFVNHLHQKSSLDFNHIMLYKSIQPFPLRESIEKLKIRDASKIPDPPKANQVEIMKLNNIRDFLNQNAQLGLMAKLSQDERLNSLVKADIIQNLKRKMGKS